MGKITVINSKGYKVNGQFVLPKNDIDKIVITCHGFGSDKNSSTIVALADKLSKSGIGVISFDFTGHGDSETATEEISITNCIEDIKAIVTYVRDTYKNAKVGIFASSFGASVALNYLFKTKNTVDALVLRCPAIEMDYIFKNVIAKEDIDIIKNKGFTHVRYESEKQILYSFYEDTMKYNLYELYKNNPMKILIIHGSKDDVAPVEHTQKFANIHPELARLVVFEGTDHRFKKEGELDRVTEISLRYFENCFLID